MAPRLRLDAELVRRGLVASRARAKELVESRGVTVNGSVAEKVTRLVDPGDAIELRGPAARFVGRGGDKLAGALDAFGIDPAGSRCLDAGASTGGFTDCLLQHGATEVIAVDVGYGQLHESLVGSPKVQNRERTNIRHLGPGDVGGPVELLVADLSFISLRTVLGALVGLVVDGGDLVVLVKPQFEAGRSEASRARGVIRDPEVWRRVLHEVAAAAEAEEAGLLAAVVSPIRGGDGNVEFLFHLRRGAGRSEVDLDALVDSVGPG